MHEGIINMASVVDTSVKYMHADMPGAPALQGVAGGMVSLLDAFLLGSGWGVKAVDSAVISGGKCRMNFSTGLSAAQPHAVIVVAGATPDALNGEQKVTVVSSGYLEFATDLPDGAVTGSITFKMAGLGWDKVYTATNIAVYRPADPAGTRFFLRVDDTNPTFARVTVYESMTDVNTGVGKMPTSAVINTGYVWWKSNSPSVQGKEYVFIGDARGFYPGVAAAQNVGGLGTSGVNFPYCGDLVSDRSGDAFGTALTGGIGGAVGVSLVHGNVFMAEAVNYRSVMRRASGVGPSQTCDRSAYGSTNSGANGALGPCLSPAGNVLLTTDIIFSDGGVFSTNGPRGALPGAQCCIQTGSQAVFGYGMGFVAGHGQYLGKTLLHINTSSVADAGVTNLGTAFFDITGPWR